MLVWLRFFVLVLLVGMIPFLPAFVQDGGAADTDDDVFWGSIDCGSEVEVGLYLEAFPKGRHVEAARACLERIEGKKGRSDQVEEILSECRAHYESNRLTRGSAGNALDCYREVLEMDRGNAEALSGIGRIEGYFEEKAESDLQASRPDDALSSIERLEWINPEHPRLDELKQRAGELSERLSARQQLLREFETVLAQGQFEQARSLLESGRKDLLDDNTVSSLERRIERERSLRDGMDRVRALIAAGDLAAARSAIEELAQLGLDEVRRAELESELDAAESARDVRTAGETFRDCDVCPEMVVVPAGSFRMGSHASEEGRWDNEGPVHRVTIRQPFAVGRYEVTLSQYANFVDWTGHRSTGGCWIYDGEWNESDYHSWRDPGFAQGEDDPVVCVSWEDARAYVRWLSSKTGENYRLLTEAEWEYVARAGTTGPFHFGSTISTDQANYDGGYTYGNGRTGVYRKKTVPVGTFPANAFGLHDVHGNVWEWVEDCWHGSYNGAPSDGSAWTSGGDCSLRVLRGGSWYSKPRSLRSAYRFRSEPGDRRSKNGFRVARTLAP